MTDLTAPDALVDATVRENWGTGGIVDMRLTARVPLARWELDIDVGGEIVNIWNAEILARAGTTYTIGGAQFNAALTQGGVAEFGFQVIGEVDPQPLAVTVDLSEAGGTPAPPAPPEPAAAVPAPPAPAPPPAEDVTVATAAGANLGARALVPTGEGIGAGAERLSPTRETLRNTDEGLDLTVTGSTVRETPGDGAGLPGYVFAPGPLSTRGIDIIDSSGAPVELRGINWFGLETEIFAPHGLWARNWREIMDDIKSLGFNTLRVPFSGTLVETGGGTPSGIDTALNPDLVGLNGLEILDAVVAYADKIGLRILLDYHRSDPGGGPNKGGLWFGPQSSEADVIANWQTIAERYKDAPAVIGADVFNEPYGGTWGDGSPTDWAAAAERIGAAIQRIAPDWLIVVEGIAVYDGDTYWWGGNLQGVADRPVRLPVADKLVYSPHDYPASVFPQPWFTDGTDLTDKFRQNWGFIAEEGIAPVLVGEWGSRLETAEDLRWARELSAYMTEHGVNWLWWSLNPNSGDTGGLFADDWETLRQPVVTLLDPFLAPIRPELGFDDLAGRVEEATFTVTLDRPAETDLQLKYATTDGTAEAGLDYVATAGLLDFGAGERTKTIRVPILPDMDAEGDEFFYMIIAGAGAARGSATAVIVDDDQRTAGLPFADVAGTIAPADADAVRFQIVLSAAAGRDVTLGFTTREEDAPGRPATSGEVVIPAGAREATLEVGVPNGGPDAGSRRFSLELTSADGAEIRNGQSSALLVADAPGAAEVEVASATADTQLTIDLIMENDWGTGALYNISIRNVSGAPVSAWQLALDLPFELDELWSAVLVSDDGGRFTIRNADWNGAIGPGQTVNFGFISDAGGIPLAQILSGADLELAIQ
jgi:aryl-phospho-beta-D-glucosidase BglC (GH1 family)